MWRHVQPYLGRPKPAILHWTPDHLHLSLKQAEPCFFLDAKKVFSLPKPDQSTSTTLWEERNREFNLNTQGNVSETNLLTTFILATELLNCERTTTAAVWYADTVMWFWKSLVINLFSHSGARMCSNDFNMSCRVVDNSLWALQYTSHTHLIYFHKYKLSVKPLCCSLAVWFMKAGVRFFAQTSRPRAALNKQRAWKNVMRNTRHRPRHSLHRRRSSRSEWLPINNLRNKKKQMSNTPSLLCNYWNPEETLMWLLARGAYRYTTTTFTTLWIEMRHMKSQ